MQLEKTVVISVECGRWREEDRSLKSQYVVGSLAKEGQVLKACCGLVSRCFGQDDSGALLVVQVAEYGNNN